MRHLTWLDVTALGLMMVGGLNWGLVGFFDLNLIANIFGSILGRLIFSLIGLSALYSLYIFGKIEADTVGKDEKPEKSHRAA